MYYSQRKSHLETFKLDRAVSGVWNRPKISPEKKDPGRGKRDTPPFFSCNLLHFATMHNFAMAEKTMAIKKSSLNKKIQVNLRLSIAQFKLIH